MHEEQREGLNGGSFTPLLFLPHLHAIPVLLVGNVALENMIHILFTRKLLPPHGPKLLRLPPALQVKQVIVPQLPKGRGGGVSPAAVGEVVPLLRPVDVALGAHGPEDGAHVLRLSLVVGRGFPGEGLESEGVLAPHAETLQDLDHSHLSVQGVEMDPLHLEEGREGGVRVESEGVGVSGRGEWSEGRAE